MLNVNQITSMLRRLQPDTALQEYAKANKDNPYIMALALSEAKRREKMKIAAQANAPEQPKVVDQAIQSMAAPMPEDIGIAQLPAGDMNFADGGIVAFDEGGPVERYQSGGQLGSAFSTFLKNTGQVSAYANGTPAQKAAIEAAFRTAVQGPFVPPAGAAPGAAPAAAAPAGAAPAASNPEGWYRRLLAGKPLPKVISGVAALDIAGLPLVGATALTAAMQEMRDQGYTADPRGEFDPGDGTAAQLTFDEDRRRRAISAMSREDRLRKFGTADVNLAMAGGASSPAGREAAATAPPTAAPAAAAPATASGAPAAAAPNAGAGGPRQNTAGRRNLGAGTPPAAAAAPAAVRDPLIDRLMQPVTAVPVNFEPSQATFPTLEQIQKLYADNRVKPENVVDPQAEQQQELINLAAFQNAQEQAAHAREVKERGLLGEKQEARLKAREEKLVKQEKDLGPLAAIQAGLAIMSGSSRSALQNIGAGAQVGLRGYTEGLEKLQTARERIEDGLERIETARRSEGILDNQQRSALRRDGNKIILDGKRDSINAWRTEFGRQTNEATALTNAGIKMLTDKAAAGSAERLGLAQIEAANIRSAREQESSGLRTAAQLSTQERIATMETAAKQADAAARLAELRSQVGTKNEAALVADYAKNPMKLKILEQTDPALAAYIRQRIQVMTTPAAQSAPGPGGARS
jgi:hypothetical protein